MALSHDEIDRIRQQMMGGVARVTPAAPMIEQAPPTPEVQAAEAPAGGIFGVEFIDQDARDIGTLATEYIRTSLTIDFTLGRHLITTPGQFMTDEDLIKSDDPIAKRIVAETNGPIAKLLAIRTVIASIFDTQPYRMVRRLVQEDIDSAERHILTAYFLDGCRDTLGDGMVDQGIQEEMTLMGEDMVEVVNFAVSLAQPEEQRTIQAMDATVNKYSKAFGGDFATGATNRRILLAVMQGTGIFGWCEQHVPPFLSVFPIAGEAGVKDVLELIRRFTKGKGAEAFVKWFKGGRKQVSASSPLVQELKAAMMRRTGATLPKVGSAEFIMPKDMNLALVGIMGVEYPGPLRDFGRVLSREMVIASGKGPESGMSEARVAELIANAINATKGQNAQATLLQDFILGLNETSSVGGKAVRALGKRSSEAATRAGQRTAQSSVKKVPPQQRQKVRAGEEQLAQDLNLHESTAAESNLQNEAERRTESARSALSITKKDLENIHKIMDAEAFQAAAIRSLRDELGGLAPKGVLEIVDLTDPILLAREIEKITPITGPIAVLLEDLAKIRSTIESFDVAPQMKIPDIEQARRASRALFTEVEGYKAQLKETTLRVELQEIFDGQLVAADEALTEVGRRMGIWNVNFNQGQLELGARLSREVPNNLKGAAARTALLKSPTEIENQIVQRGEEVTQEVRDGLITPLSQFRQAQVRFAVAYDSGKFAEADGIVGDMATARRLYDFNLAKTELKPFSKSVFTAEAKALEQTLNDMADILAVTRGAARIGQKEFLTAVWQRRIRIALRIGLASVLFAPIVVLFINVFGFLKANLLLFFVLTQADVLIWGPGSISEATGEDVFGDLQANKRVNNIFWDFRDAFRNFQAAQRDRNIYDAEKWFAQMEANRDNLDLAITNGKRGLTPVAGGFSEQSLENAEQRLEYADLAIEQSSNALEALRLTGITPKAARATEIVEGFTGGITGLLIAASKAITEDRLDVATEALLEAEAGVRAMEEQLEEVLDEVPPKDKQRLDFQIRAFKTNITLQRERILGKQQNVDTLPQRNRTTPRGNPTAAQIRELRRLGVAEETIKKMNRDQASVLIGNQTAKDVNSGVRRVPD